MIEELLCNFSRENFDDAKYLPLLHGHSETAKPLSLIIVRQRGSLTKYEEIRFFTFVHEFSIFSVSCS